MLAEWGYRLRHCDDTLLPMVLGQLFLLNRSPHLEEFGIEFFERVRRDGLLGGARLNAVHAVQRAVNALGFCGPTARDHRSWYCSGGRRCADLAAVGRPLVRDFDVDAASTRQRRSPHLLKVGLSAGYRRLEPTRLAAHPFDSRNWI